MNEIGPTDEIACLPRQPGRRLLVYGCDRELRYTWIVNPTEGFSTADLAGRRDDELLPLDIVADLVALKQRALDTGRGQSGEITLRLPAGPRTYDVIAEPARNPEGQVIGLTVAAFDLTDRREAERALRDSEARLALATTAADIGIWDWDLITNRIVYSPRAKAICGLPPEQDVTYEDVRRVTHPDDLPFTSAQARRALDPTVRERSPFEYRIVRPDGAVRWVLAYGEPVFAKMNGQERAVRYVGTIQDITERRRLEQTERASAQRLRLALDAGRMAVWEADLVHDSVTISPELNRLLGFPEDAAPTTEEMRARYYPGERERLQEIGRAALARGERHFEATYRYLWPDGQVRWLMMRANVRLDHDGTPVGALGVVVDVTDRRRIAEALEASKERLRLGLAAGRMVAWEYDLRTGAVVRSENADEIFGPGGEAEEFSARMPAEDRLADQARLAAAIAGASPAYDSEFRYRHPDGALLWLHNQGMVIRDEAGHPVRVHGVCIDITARKASQQALRDETHALDILNRTGARIAAELDPEKLVQMVVDAGVDLTGAQFGAFFYNVTDESGESYMLYALSGESRETFAGAPKPRITTLFGPTFRGECIVRSGDIMRDPHYGRNQPLHGMPDWHLPVRSYLAVPVVSRSGEVIGALLFGHRQPDMFSERSERLTTGLAAQAAIGIDNARLFQTVQRLNETLELQVEQRTAELRQALERLRTEAAERQQAEDALRQAQKMEAIGQLTGGIAHDFNNLLTGIAGSLELLQTRAAQGRTTELGRYVTAAMTSVTRASALTHRLLAFARRQALDPKPTNVNKLVASMEELIRRTVGPAIRLETVLSAGLWLTLCDANQLESALLNLCINARDAMPDGGRLTLETANAFLDDAYAATERDVRAGQYVSLSVTDTGTGMTPDVLARAFEPFYTTKPIGQGTGLGLSMLYGFVKQSEGHVRIYSEVGQGTTVRLYLPRRHNGEADIEAAASFRHEPAPAVASSGTVLVVEDEAVVRALVVEVLTDLGYATLEAADGPAGLRILHSAARVDLLVSDVGLPGLNGRQLADAARERRPDLKVLFITGYAHNAAIGNGLLEPGMEMIAKPFALDALAAKIRSMLAESSSCPGPA